MNCRRKNLRKRSALGIWSKLQSHTSQLLQQDFQFTRQLHTMSTILECLEIWTCLKHLVDSPMHGLLVFMIATNGFKWASLLQSKLSLFQLREESIRLKTSSLQRTRFYTPRMESHGSIMTTLEYFKQILMEKQLLQINLSFLWLLEQ